MKIKIKSYIGIAFDAPRGVNRRQFIKKTISGDTISVTSPCKTTVVWKSSAKLPTIDMPCPCGNPNHWLVKWFEK